MLDEEAKSAAASKKESTVPGLKLHLLNDQYDGQENVDTAPAAPAGKTKGMSPKVSKKARAVLSPTQMENSASPALVRTQTENTISQETQENVKAALVRTQMENTVSQETQENVKAALVRTQIENTISQVTQENVKAALVRTQMENTVSQETQENVKAALVRTQMENTVSQETQENVKAALVRTQMENTVSQEAQENVRAALVRTQMEGKISQEAQVNVKNALLRTQQQENANEIRLSSLKASLGVVDQSTQPTSLTLPDDPLDGAFEKTWAAAEKAGAILQEIGRPAQQLPECTQLPECAADDMPLMSPRTQRIAERNANKLSFLRTKILAPTGTPLPSAQLAAAPYTVNSTEHQVAAPKPAPAAVAPAPAPRQAPVTTAPSSEWSGFSSMGPPRVQETQQPAPQLSVSSLSMGLHDHSAQSYLHEGGATESAMVPAESGECTRLQKLQQRTREDMREEMQQILQTNDHDQVLRAVLASPISSYFAVRVLCLSRVLACCLSFCLLSSSGSGSGASKARAVRDQPNRLIGQARPFAMLSKPCGCAQQVPESDQPGGTSTEGAASG